MTLTQALDPVPPSLAAAMKRPRCPLVRGALRSADPAVVAKVVTVHPVERCPAARQERAA